MRSKKRCKCQWQVARYWWDVQHKFFPSCGIIYGRRPELNSLSLSLSLHTFIYIHSCCIESKQIGKIGQNRSGTNAKNNNDANDDGERWLFGKRMKAMCTCVYVCVRVFFFSPSSDGSKKTPTKSSTKVHRERKSRWSRQSKVGNVRWRRKHKTCRNEKKRHRQTLIHCALCAEWEREYESVGLCVFFFHFECEWILVCRLGFWFTSFFLRDTMFLPPLFANGNRTRDETKTERPRKKAHTTHGAYDANKNKNNELGQIFCCYCWLLFCCAGTLCLSCVSANHIVHYIHTERVKKNQNTEWISEHKKSQQ